MCRQVHRCCAILAATLVACTASGCAGWLPGGREPDPIKPSFGSIEVPKDAVGIETILIRLSPYQVSQLNEVWAMLDEQSVAPERRFVMDRNGIRVAKAPGQLPAILDGWLRDSERRRSGDPMEQTGLAADVTTYSQLWRCRPNSRKEVTIRNLAHDDITIFYNDGATKGATYSGPHLLFSLHAAPQGDGTASVRLTPEIQYGEASRKVVARDSAIRTDERRPNVVWDDVSIEMRLRQGDCIVLGPTHESRGLGEHFFHCMTSSGELQPVLMLARLSEMRLDDAFESAELAKAKRNNIDWQ